MSRALAGFMSVVVCVFLAGCADKKEKTDDKKSAEHKHSDHEGHDHDGHGHDDHEGHEGHDNHEHEEHDAHAPSEEPLVIVDDIVAVPGGHAKEIFADEHARVLAMDLHKGDKLPLHKGGPRVVYAVSDLKLKITEVHGGDHTHDHDAEFTAGKVLAQDAGVYGIANLADVAAEFVVFLRKEGDAFSASVPADAQTIAEATKFATQLLSNDDFRVYKVALPRGEKVAKHYALNRLVYALDDAKLTRTDADGKPETLDLQTGKVHFRAAGSSTLENSGQTQATFLVIEMKR